jgi:hypothetical protein
MSPASDKTNSRPAHLAASTSILILLLVAVAFASEGRDFAGHFALGAASSSNGQVTLNFSVRIYNYSGADVSAATVTLQSEEQPDNIHATFSPVALASSGSVKLSSQVTVSQTEYEQWRRGRAPDLFIAYKDSSGASQRRRVELTVRPGMQEVQ